MTAVLDVSAAFAMVRQLPESERLSKTLAEASWVIAPSLYVAETANVAWKLFRIERTPPQDARAMAEKALNMVDDLIPALEIWQAALDLAYRINHSVYDCFYLALCIRYGASLMTSDRKLAALAAELGIAPA